MRGKTDNAILLFIGALLLIAFVMQTPQQTGTGTKTATQSESIAGTAATTGTNPFSKGCGIGSLTTVQVGNWNPVNNSRGDVNAEFRKADGTSQVGETRANGYTSISTSMPNSFDGFLMIGNDNAVSGTDRGDEVYYARYPLSYSCEGSVARDLLNTYAEGTLTLTAYDDGTVESPLNVTVGSGATVDTTELRAAVSANGAFGNPQLDNPVGVCFNSSSPTQWDAVRPLNYQKTFDVPEFLQGRNYIGTCYVLQTKGVTSPNGAIIDSASTKNDFRFFVRLDAVAGTNPVENDGVYADFLDKTYYIDDDGKWAIGWEDKSTTAADVDIGSVEQRIRMIIF